MTSPDSELSAIYRFELLADGLATSGQPRAVQFESIADAGYEAVINLALPTSENAIADEGSIVTALGLAYFHIPVEMERPTADNLKTFIGLMRALNGKKVWVHCVANVGVSAFAYRYLRHVKGVDDSAKTRLFVRWEPKMDQTWRDFIALTP